MNIKQLKAKIDGLSKNRDALEAKRDAALKSLDEKRAALKADWDEKVSAAQAEIDKFSKALKEQERIEALLKQAQESADALIGGDKSDQ